MIPGRIQLAGAALVVLALTSWALFERASSARAQAQLVEYRAAYEVLAAKVVEQNAAVVRLERQSVEASARAAQAAKAAAAAGDLHRSRADALRSAADAPAQDECPAGQAVAEVRAILSGGPAR